MICYRNEITIVIPSLNEAEGIEGIVNNCLDHSSEVLVLDGNSTDGTTEIAADSGATVFTVSSGGKGSAVRLGIEKATRGIVVFIDADGSHDTDDIPKLVEPILDGRADMAIASRLLGGSEDFYLDYNNLVRQFGSQLTTCMVNMKYHVQLTDIHNGYRAIARKAAIDLKLTSKEFEIEEEMVIRCLKNKYKIVEVSSHEHARKWGKSKLPTRKGWRIMFRFMREIVS